MASRKRKSSNRAVTGGRHRTVYNNREKAYRALKKKMPVGKAAAIANAGKNKAGRKRMAKKAARTRKRRSR